MIRILDSDKNGKGTKMYETPYCYYVNNIEYEKQEMLHTPFKSFDDRNEPTYNNICFNQMLSPYINSHHYNGLKNGSILADNKNKGISYIAHFDTSDDITSTPRYARIGIIEQNKDVRIINTCINTGYIYTYNNNIIKFLGQTDTHIYAVIVGSYKSTGYISQKPYDYYNTTHGVGSLESEIVLIEKNALLSTKEGEQYKYTSIATFPRSYGDIKIIKDTNSEIYCLVSICDDSGNQYEIFKINKADNTYSSIEKFKDDFDENEKSDIITPSDVIRIDDDNYIFYVALMKKGGQMIGSNGNKHKYYLYKCKFTISSNTLEKVKINMNESDLPYFGYRVGVYYNSIYHFEQDGTDYLITSTNMFYKGNKKQEPNDKIISYYRINNGGDTPTCELIDKIQAKTLLGEFYGLLFNKEDKTCLAMTSFTSYLISFANDIKIVDLHNKPKEVGIDLQGNYFGSNDDTSVLIYGKSKVSSIQLIPPDIPDKATYPYTTSIKLSAFNYEGTRIVLPVRLSLVGDNVTFNENSATVLVKETLDSGDTDVQITITDNSIFEVYADVEREYII